MDGRYSYDKLAELSDNDDQFSNAKKRIEKADALKLNEISMLSLIPFEMVEFVCRHVKKSSKIFGVYRTIPRKTKQALRTKIQALGDRQTPSTSKVVCPKRTAKTSKDDEEQTSITKKKHLAHEWSETEIYICSICQLECDWEPDEIQFQSIACDKCNCWFHYKCVKIKGTEHF
ncbi:unnamed protein product [Mytilus edulis]|uniref:Uncharacterized protein n=1 Tax=Mytilus edulis TaxID=6550 RepID=A0A8S3QQH4_MYTED|nr:unnamed protein product [Mytilus edulis]